MNDTGIPPADQTESRGEEPGDSDVNIAKPNIDEVQKKPVDVKAPPLEKLVGAINDVAQTARTLFTALLATAVGMASTVLATTDLALLHESFELSSALGIKISVVHVYAFAPPVFLFLHVNGLLQLHLLRLRLRALNDELIRGKATADERTAWYRLLHGFVFVQMFSREGATRSSQVLMRMMAWLTLVFVPLALLLAMQVSFLRYQSDAISFTHKLWLMIDVGILGWFLWQDYAWDRDHHPETWWDVRAVCHACGGLFAIAFGLFVATPLGPDEKWIEFRERLSCASDYWHGRARKECGPITSALHAPLLLLIKGMNPLDMQWCAAWSIGCRYLTLNDLVLAHPSSKIPAVDKIGLPEDERKRAEAKAAGLFLRDRSLRFANLLNAFLPGAHLEGSDLRGALLDRASLLGAGVDRSQLQSASLIWAQLQGASLYGAQLQGVWLYGAQLQGAALADAQLQGAALVGAQLQGANLHRTQLQGADLYRAQLQGALLNDAQLQGASLNDAQLQGASLVGAQLQGASLDEAALDGALFVESDLRSASINTDAFDLADFRGAAPWREMPDPWSPEEAEKLWKAIEPMLAFLSAERAGEIRDRIMGRAGRLSSISFRKQTAPVSGVLASPDAPWGQDVRTQDFDAYRDKLAEFLRGLACDDKWTARGIVRNWGSLNLLKYADASPDNRAAAGRVVVTVQQTLLSALNPDSCTGIQTVPQDRRKRPPELFSEARAKLAQGLRKLSEQFDRTLDE
jgi:uncharacterized protein YjbI with pentapeptide repeats